MTLIGLARFTVGVTVTPFGVLLPVPGAVPLIWTVRRWVRARVVGQVAESALLLGAVTVIASTWALIVGMSR